MKARRAMVCQGHAVMSKRRRTHLLGVNLSTLYSARKPVASDTVTLLNEIQDIYARQPFKGYRRIAHDLQDRGYSVNHKRVLRLMRVMGLQAVYPKKNLSKRRQADAVYPYLLKETPPQVPHDCWCVDITYIKMATGYIYLTGFIDVASHYLMGWHVSTTLETESCLRALEMALKTGHKPKIINSDQGCQFTSQDWVDTLTRHGIAISMDGKGRCLDNISIERFWRTLKYEEVYLKSYDSVSEACHSIGAFIEWYNRQRRHQGLGYRTPYQALTGYLPENPQFSRPDGFVDNTDALPTSSTGPTTTAALFNTLTKGNVSELSLIRAA